MLRQKRERWFKRIGERKEKRGLISILSGSLTQGGEIRYFRGPWFTTGPINLDMCVTVFSVKWHWDTTRKFQNSVCVTDVTLFALMIGHKTSLGTLTLLSITLFPHISVVVLSHLFPPTSVRSQIEVSTIGRKREWKVDLHMISYF